ncbi:DNA-protecting protein DprA [Stutzerimonas kirkiae]|uniref:DNA-protecting protein DprA n=1 Tax=Stutzerimonas kirkiae TaxID=2211392 RepID=A0A4Q9R1X9_9GAMM|nr:DNA-processing protein DprA [Stutzerimonas kirkiae]TBU93268.1 DNA-protecting protein DprA [Stutzerimonas kirkiae]TBV01402.1 DNA-protecting protein DprA [Stutzerimonas kirkiae]
MSPAELEARLRLHLLPELGPLRLQRLFEAFPDASSALSAPASAWRALGLPDACAEARRTAEIRERAALALAWLEQPAHRLLAREDPDYPALLGELEDAPPLLFVAGDPESLQRPQLAMVGSRRASHYGLDIASAFARSLASAGFVIGSGLALGIDGAAHQGALDAGGRTVAVLGTGLQCIYPQRHRKLAQRIIEGGGALLSELPLDCQPQASNFPRRNRLISGMALGVLVIEASPSSGSLITARLAAEQGREVYAIPGSIHHPGARGCHQLIRQGATLVETVEDILEGLRGWQRIGATATAPTPRDPLLQQLTAAPASAEVLADRLARPLNEVLAELTELEITGQAACEQGQWSIRRI